MTRARRWKMIGHALRYPEEMHKIRMYDKRMERKLQDAHGTLKIKSYAKVKTFKKLKKKQANRQNKELEL